jgi:preprotein translocase subunit YajC
LGESGGDGRDPVRLRSSCGPGPLPAIEQAQHLYGIITRLRKFDRFLSKYQSGAFPMSFLISDAWAQGASSGGFADGGMSLIFLVGMFVVMYFFLIRPQVKRQKEHKALVEGLKKGDEVQTMGGLMGRIIEVGDNLIKVEIAENTVVAVRRAAVEAVMPKGSLKEM